MIRGLTILTFVLVLPAVTIVLLSQRKGSARQVPLFIEIPALSDPERAGRRVVFNPRLKRRDDPTLTQADRQAIAMLDADIGMGAEDVLYDVSWGALKDGTPTGTWQIEYYRVTGRTRSGYPLSACMELATLSERGTIHSHQMAVSLAGPVMIVLSDFPDVTALPVSQQTQGPTTGR